jgi:hypothetical protein
MSARPGPRGGYRVSGIPTAISLTPSVATSATGVKTGVSPENPDGRLAAFAALYPRNH